MQTGKIRVRAILIMVLLGASPAFANEQPTIRADTKAAFDVVAAAVRHEMGPRGRYEFVQGTDRVVVETRLSEMQSLFDRFGSVANMDQDARVRLFNDQEAVNGILTRDDANREICQKIAPTGTRITKTFCRTYGEVRRQRAGDQSLLNQMQGMNPQRRGGGCPSGRCNQDPSGGAMGIVGH